MRKLIQICMLLLLTVGFSQTGINTGEVSPHAALQISAPNHDKGLLIPRLTTVQRDAIPSGVTENGLMIYNLDEQCLNFWSVQERAWLSLCGKVEKAVFKVTNCRNLMTYGVYKKEEGLDGGHFLTVEVEVTKPGPYTIVAHAADYNGYYYAISGEFVSAGKFELKIPASGKPLEAQSDNFTLMLNEATASCTFTVEVEDYTIAPDYRMNCETVKVVGIYNRGGALGSDNYIEVTLNVSEATLAEMTANKTAYFVIETDEVDGISFRAEGKLTAATQTVKLAGRGIPISTNDKVFKIRSNSTLTTGICTAKIVMSIPGKRLLSVANGGVGDNNFADPGTRDNPKRTYALVTTVQNFGKFFSTTEGRSSIVYSEGIIFAKNSSNQIYTTLSLMEAQKHLVDTPVDILTIGYSYIITEEIAEIIADYLKKGGVVLLYSQATLGTERLLRNLTGSNSIKINTGERGGAVYKFSNVDDPVLNGPFGDVRGKQWGKSNTDADGTKLVEGIDTSRIVVYSDGYDWSNNTQQPGVSAFRHKDYHLIYVGDGGFNEGGGSYGETIKYPFRNDALFNRPVPRSNYGRGDRFTVYNSIFTANAVAWALKMAEESGINSNNRDR